MTTSPTPERAELPSASRLFRSTLVALAIAALILLVAVLPAEYGVDPTGAGRVLGLTQMGEIKVSLAREAAAEDAAAAEEAASEHAALSEGPAGGAAAEAAADTAWRHITEIQLAPGEGKEVKLVMTKGALAVFQWSTVGGVVNHDTHGDSTAAPKSYVNYSKGTGVSADAGELVAAMDGSHGWFWRNRSGAPVVVTLRTKGDYAELKRMY